jgi:hypothetical protein
MPFAMVLGGEFDAHEPKLSSWAASGDMQQCDRPD